MLTSLARALATSRAPGRSRIAVRSSSAPLLLTLIVALSTAANACDGSSKSGSGGAAGQTDDGQGGSSAATGGSSTATGGRETGGETAAGGKASGGTAATGGKSNAATGGKGAGGATGGASATGGSGTGGSTSTSTRADIAKRLGREPNFLIGMGNDLDNDHNKDGAYTLGVTLDFHYAYLVGLLGKGGWPDWNAGGTFVNVLTDTAKAHGVTPMFTLYSMAASGENNVAVLKDDAYMKPYWDGLKLLYQRLAAFDGPALVQFEPDFWGYVQQASKSNPASVPVHVTTLAPDCAALTDDLAGLGKCMVLLGHKYAPKALLAFHVSGWADGDANKIAKFMVDIGAGEADLVTTDFLDRDAGCFEAHTDPNCQRGGTTGWYWDETNATSPNFHEHLAWVKTITTGTGKPMLWWQTPFGVPSTTPGGTAGKYRDNRVKYVFSHVEEFIEAGGIGVGFGTGAENQTFITTDGGQFKAAATKYFSAPVPLP